MNRVKKNDLKCSQCGLSREQMEQMLYPEEPEEKKAVQPETKQEARPVEAQSDGGVKIDTAAILSGEATTLPDEPQGAEQEEKDKKAEAAKESNQPDPEVGIADDDIGKVNVQTKRHKHKRKKSDLPNYTVDENGDYDIDTSDVTYLEGVENPTYSVKKARGEVETEKLKWWEIYKWADRMLAKRKISKEVNKASHKEPFGVKRWAMIVLCLLFGWMGAHNFYAKNYKRGWFVLISMFVVFIVTGVDKLAEIMGVFVGGGLGFVVLAMWIYDFICLIFNKYRYRISREEFISNLNVETRAKLGKKYIKMDKASFKAKEKARQEKILNKRNKHKRK